MRTDKQLLNLYGLKYNPFQPELPDEALWQPPGADLFLARTERLVQRGGFALICGDAGLGKSKMLQLLDSRLRRMGDVMVGVQERPQSSLGDFYRELGELFGVNLAPANRYGGFKALRERWLEHSKSTLLRPVLLVDEAQEAPTECLTELRLLGSAHFDSQCLLTVVLCGDPRLPERFRGRELMPLGSRTHTRLLLEAYSSDDLLDFLEHSIEQAGAAHLMSKELKHVLCEHAAGNPRVLTQMAAELLAEGAERELATLDDKLFIELFSGTARTRRRKTTSAKAAR